jgi:hypothetical protein
LGGVGGWGKAGEDGQSKEGGGRKSLALGHQEIPCLGPICARTPIFSARARANHARAKRSRQNALLRPHIRQRDRPGRAARAAAASHACFQGRVHVWDSPRNLLLTAEINDSRIHPSQQLLP